MKLIDYKAGQHNTQPDPFILKGNDGRFYIYATGATGVHAYVSDTLAGEYEYIGIVFSAPGKKEYWAPSVTLIGDKYYMYVSFVNEDSDDAHEQTMHVAASDSPRGPFTDPRPIIAPFSIDSHVVSTASGLFIFYSTNDYDAERAGTYIAVDKMSDPYTCVGNPKKILAATLDEEIFMRNRFKEGQHWHTLEGAFYFEKDGYHYVIYSGNCYESEYYYLGYAVAKTTETDLTKIDFVKYPDPDTYMPLISANDFEAGTGHNSVIEVDGEYYCIYHGRDIPPDPRLGAAESRTARICRLKVEGGVIEAIRYPDKI